MLAWRTPPSATASENGANEPTGSMVPWAQRRLLEATRQALAAVAADVNAGLMETVGVRATWVEGERAAVQIHLPEGTDKSRIAAAIDLENVEAWVTEQGELRVGIGPWYTTKETDQVVLSVIKVVHVLLGLHGAAASTDDHQHEYSHGPEETEQPSGHRFRILKEAKVIIDLVRGTSRR
ncbi:MAG: hypothetical protein WKF30_04190 [Pyrinomonadaceae bacterium]